MFHGTKGRAGAPFSLRNPQRPKKLCRTKGESHTIDLDVNVN